MNASDQLRLLHPPNEPRVPSQDVAFNASSTKQTETYTLPFNCPPAILLPAIDAAQLTRTSIIAQLNSTIRKDASNCKRYSEVLLDIDPSDVTSTNQIREMLEQRGYKDIDVKAIVTRTVSKLRIYFKW